MNLWFNFIIGLFLGLESGLLAGLINPKWVGSEKRSYVFTWMIIFFILFIIVGLFLDNQEHKVHGAETLVFLVLWFGAIYLIISKKILSLLFLGMKIQSKEKDVENKKIKNLTPSINLKMTVTKSYNSDEYEVDQYLDEIPIYAKVSEKNKDSFEGWFYDEVPDYIEVNKSLRIKYKDANSNITERLILVRKFGKADFGGFLLSHCYLREESRTFRTDRILECINTETGEIIYDISAYLIESYKSTPKYKRKVAKEQEYKYYAEFMEKYMLLLKVLVYIVKCDGTYNLKEKAIVREIFEGLEENNELLTEKMLNKIFKEIPLSTFREFKINVTKIISEYDFDVVEFTENVIATQKSIHEQEKELLEYFETTLNIDNLTNRVSEKIKASRGEQKESTKSGKLCPSCDSDYITKKGQRVLKKGKIQRYQCQSCNKVFSEDID